MDNLDILGYVGTILVIISFTFSNDKIKHLRIFSIIACVVFIIYSILRNDIPVVVTNSCIILANLYHLIKDFFKK